MNAREITGIFIDLDGTTLRPDGTMSGLTRMVIDELQDQQKEVVVDTGRPLALGVAGLELPGYGIFDGGSSIYSSVVAGELAVSRALSVATVGLIAEGMAGLCTDLEANNQKVQALDAAAVFAGSSAPFVFGKFRREQQAAVLDVLQQVPGITFDANMTYKGDPSGHTRCFQARPENVDKGTAADYVMDQLGGIWAAFGDDVNDEPMHAAVRRRGGWAVAAGQKSRELLRRSQIVVTGNPATALYRGTVACGLIKPRNLRLHTLQ